MPKLSRQPSPGDEPLLALIRAMSIARREVTRERRRLVLQANQGGLSARNLARLLDVPEGTISTWIRQAKAEGDVVASLSSEKD
ncbi:MULTISPECIES: helix-turn-helix domain-containing protein [unclassified Frondihabitans]|uniref:helix-turn-helix domain-containing protein n=1 Tax=unclassified Frondihabitans TaxID=2626248 RepID=UPI000F4E25DD|nr:helix-turn-helix protein [Frondihabitans sp. PhB153]RPF08140.1 helix-turn-helix protein [Frondihabitans sp. PhB161]